MSGKVLAELNYEPRSVNRGYADKTLYVNVTDKEIKEKDVTQEMKDKFVGGKGFGLYYLWQAVTGDTKWDDPENEIVISPGPVAGITQYPGAGKSLVVSISPLTNSIMDSNVGGHFGPYLKFSGYDALELQGKSDKDVIIFIDGDKHKVTIEESDLEGVDSHLIGHKLTDRFAESEEDKKNISVVSTGRGGDNTLIGLLNFTYYDPRRKEARMKQAGRGGIGTVLRDKKITAIVAKFSDLKPDSNHPADLPKIQETGLKVHKEIAQFDDEMNRMRQVGTAHIVEIVNNYELMPTHNFKFGSHPDGKNLYSNVFRDNYLGQNVPDECWYGCSMSCSKAADGFELKTGPYKGEKVLVDGPEYETTAAVGSNPGIFDPEYVLEANFYCDTYGMDTISPGDIIAFAMDCYENGILDKDKTGGLELTFGNKDAALELIHQMGQGKGFGKVAGLGIKRMKEKFIQEYGADSEFLNDIAMENKGLEYSMYLPKESLVQQAGYGLANKGPQHDEALVVFMDQVNNQLPTFEAKADALNYFPKFRTWFGLQGLCKLPWNDIVPEDNDEEPEPHKVPDHVRNYVKIFNAVTGKNIDQEEMLRQSERVHNFQRIFNLRLGFGTREYDMPPYRSMGPVTEDEYKSREDYFDSRVKEDLGLNPEDMSIAEKIEALKKYRRENYDKLADAVYEMRGWTKDGVPTIEKLKELGIDYPDVVEVVKPYQ